MRKWIIVLFLVIAAGAVGGLPTIHGFATPTVSMLDINLLRKDLAFVVGRLEARQSPQPFLDVARFQALEAERKTIQTRTEELQARRNSLSKQIGQRKGKGEDSTELMGEVGGIGDELKASAERLERLTAGHTARDCRWVHEQLPHALARSRDGVSAFEGHAAIMRRAVRWR